MRLSQRTTILTIRAHIIMMVTFLWPQTVKVLFI